MSSPSLLPRNNMITLSSKKQASGQAIVEFVVAATFVIVPMWLATLAIGKFIDVQHTAHMASRYAAWERTVWYENPNTAFNTHNQPNGKSSSAIQNEITVRIINNRSSSSNTINSDDKSANKFARGMDPLWVDDASKPYLKNYEQVSITQAAENVPSDFASKALNAIGSLKVAEFAVGTLVPPVPSDGTFATTTVTFSDVAKDSLVYKRLWAKSATGAANDWAGITFASESAILTNGWGANSREGTQKMVQASLPMASSAADVFEKIVKTIIWAWDPFLIGRTPEFGKVEPDVVPEDRLQ